MRRRWNNALGGLLVMAAVLMERATAGTRAARRWRRLRDGVLRAAHGRGVTVEVLAARVGLSRSRVHTVVRRPADGPDDGQDDARAAS